MRTHYQAAVIDEEHVMTFRQLLRVAPDDLVRRPLWEFKPNQATAVLAERTRRGFNLDPEPIGDPAYQ